MISMKKGMHYHSITSQTVFISMCDEDLKKSEDFSWIRMRTPNPNTTWTRKNFNFGMNGYPPEISR